MCVCEHSKVKVYFAKAFMQCLLLLSPSLGNTRAPTTTASGFWLKPLPYLRTTLMQPMQHKFCGYFVFLRPPGKQTHWLLYRFLFALSRFYGHQPGPWNSVLDAGRCSQQLGQNHSKSKGFTGLLEALMHRVLDGSCYWQIQMHSWYSSWCHASESLSNRARIDSPRWAFTVL